MAETIITGLDLGSSNIRVAMLSLDKKGEIKVLALENIASKGIDSGSIINFDIASLDIRNILKRVEEKTQKRIKNMYVAIKGRGVSGLQAKGLLALGKRPRQIGMSDVEKCVRIASMIRLPESKQIMQTEIQTFYINEGDVVANPQGLYATKLGMDIYVLTADIAYMKNLYRCIEHSGYILQGTVFAPIATKMIISEFDKSREGKSILIDIGSHSTALACFNKNIISHIETLSTGSMDLLDEKAVKSFIVEIKRISVKEKIEEIIFTGGGALKEDLIETVEEALDIPCRMGHASVEGCSLDPSDAICHTGSIGAAMYQARKISKSSSCSICVRLVRSFTSMLESYF